MGVQRQKQKRRFILGYMLWPDQKDIWFLSMFDPLKEVSQLDFSDLVAFIDWNKIGNGHLPNGVPVISRMFIKHALFILMDY